jgi:hypothetical protein
MDDDTKSPRLRVKTATVKGPPIHRGAGDFTDDRAVRDEARATQATARHAMRITNSVVHLYDVDLLTGREAIDMLRRVEVVVRIRQRQSNE